MEKPQAYAHFAIYDRVESLLRDRNRGRLLDVPAGQGALAERLVAMGFDVSCCDLYPEIFRLESVDTCAGDLDGRLPYNDSSFDFVICVEGLEHIENPANAIREFSRILVPAGVLIISVPNIMNIEERLKWLFFGYTSHFKPVTVEGLAVTRAEHPGIEKAALHINPIGYSEVRYLLETNGFQLVDVLPDRVKSRTWAFMPVTAVIRLVLALTPKRKRHDRWATEINSKNVLLGGNTLVFEAQKI